MPEFAADRTEVKTTAFITPAAAAKPARWKTRVKGEMEMSDALEPSRLGEV